MEMRITKELGGPNHTMVFVLTEEEMSRVYDEYRTKVHFRDWIEGLLEENGYPSQDEEKLIEMTQRYCAIMERIFGDRLGELEHEAFDYMMEEYYPEITSSEDEEDEEEDE